jgi:hypothetical protein
MGERGEYRCVKQRRPEESAAAALLSVAQYHGLPLTFRDLSSWMGADSLRMDLMLLLFVARKAGFEVLPLEGDFEHLPEVARPCIVTFESDTNQHPAYAVLYEIDEHSVLIGNTATGSIERLDRETFCARWNGDVVQILRDPDGFRLLQKELEELRNPLAILRRIIGLNPLSFARLAFLPVSVAIILVAGTWRAPPWQKLAMGATGLCLLLSLWSWIYSSACASCSRVKQAAGGLPIAPAGAACYGLLFGLAAMLPPGRPLQIGLFTASGVHLFLLGLLWQSRLICWPCVATAVSVFAAGIFSIAGRADLSGWEGMAVSGGLLLAALVIVPARKLYRLQLRDTAYRLAVKVIGENVAVQPGRARMVVYVRKDCSLCSFYKTVLRGSLEGNFGDALSIEERETGREKVATPLYVISGALNIVAGELPMERAYDDLLTAIETALHPEESKLKGAGGFYLIGFGS